MQEGNKNKGIKLGALMVVLFLLMYIPSLFHWIYGKDIATDIIRSGTIEDSFNLDGLIIRDEEPIDSPFEGKYISEVGEGEKIPLKYKIATVLKDTSAKELEDLSKLDSEILKLRKEKSEKQGLFSQDIIKLDNNIAEKVSAISTACNENNFEKLVDVKKEIDIIIHKKAEILSSLGTPDSQIGALSLKRNNLQAVINAGTRQIYANSPGIISYYVDGYERVLNPNTIDTIKVDEITELLKKEIRPEVNLGTVQVNKPFAKIIKGIYIYIAVIMDKKQSDMLKLGKNVNVRINDINKIVNAVPVSISDTNGNKSTVVFKTDKGLSETTFLRKVNIDIIKNSYDGLEVSYKSLFDINPDGKMGKIVLVKANDAKIRNVEIVGRSGEFAIIKSIDKKVDGQVSLYDTYVINPSNIKEGQLIIK
ncbi:MAG TPA: HlyD family efflux transporter periplasmic adaptor subunit [Pseudobacteroides sp.]|uniref:HlyD family efflux transporter periplasmic adaptor subunit n=1 Tax=Pseudobacteroides sp. TaxID=1968840 RepID=UPI002F9342B3